MALIKGKIQNDYAMENILIELLDKEVFPALWDRLDTAFPEFGFKRKGDHWIATGESGSRSLSGSPRPERVWVYSSTSFGIKIHGGPFITWIEYVAGHSSPRGSEFIKAVRVLCLLAGVVFPEKERSSFSKPKEKSAETFHDDMYRWGREQLFSEQGQPILDYLILRGFSLEEIEKRTDLCAIPHRKHFQDEFINQKGYTIEHLKQSGLLGWGFGVNYQLVFPVRDEHGKIVSWAGRLIIPGKDKEGTDLPKYKNTFGLHKDLPYNFSRAKKPIERTKRVIIVEGFMDAAHCFAKGFENVVGILGARLLPAQLNHLVLAGATQILMCLDRDKDGEAGTEQAFDLFANYPNLNPYFIYLPPDCKDADETLKKYSHDDFDQLLNFAQPGWIWYAERISKEYDNTPDRDALLNKYANIYQKILDPIKINEFVKTLAQNTDIGILGLRKKFGLVEESKTLNKKEKGLDEFSATLEEANQILYRSKNLLELKKYFKQKHDKTFFPPRDPVAKRFKEFLKQTGPALLLKNDLEGLKNQMADLGKWIVDTRNHNINKLKKK